MLTQLVKEQCWTSRSSKGGKVTMLWPCWYKGHDLNNIVCEYEVNPLTNDKVITEIQTLHKMIKLLKNNVKCQGHLKGKVIMLHVCGKVMT